MTSLTARELEELRRKVDGIDETIVDLLSERLSVVAEIARVKRSADDHRLALRPGREAAVMRRLLARAAGRFPRGTLARMWRELFGAMTRVQSSLAVSVVVPEDQPELWDVVRDHFGSLTPIGRAANAEDALGRIAAGQAQVAVLPLPGEADRWWLGLADGPLRVQARLPFATLPGYPDHVQAYVVARLPPEPTGDDLTLLLLETDEVPNGSDPWLSRHLLRSEPEAGTVRHLVELGGFFTEDGPPLRVALAAVGGGLLRVQVLGCYARPLPAAELV
jgi:chorismate mutase / prephenate dehydratase